MTSLPRDPAAWLRGSAAGLLTAALAVAAHGVASGAPPSGAAATQLGVLAATIGALAATLRRTGDVRALIGLLGAGQLMGHLMLGLAGHHHEPAAAPPAAAMLVAHASAVAVGALLIAVSDRLCRAVSRAIRAVARPAEPPVPMATVVAVRGGDQPLRSALLLAASVSHRGPPISAVR